MFPNLPLISKTLPGFEVVNWFAVFGSKGMPADIVEKLANWINQITAMPAAKEFLTSQGADPLPGSAEQTRIKLQQAVATWQRVVTLAKIEPQ